MMKFQKKDPRAVIHTPFGDMTVRFYPSEAPRHVENFLNLAKMGFYDGLLFHRVIPKFIIQGGDPLSKQADRNLHGTGGPGYWLQPEPSDRPHKKGTLSMAKMPRDAHSTRDPNDNGSQFFICAAPASGLDRTYTAFGEVFRGLDVIDTIAAVPRDESDNPLDPIEMTITIIE
jgi:peptidyl-prolyl cis-trans isomerase B (cyclophilin B)